MVRTLVLRGVGAGAIAGLVAFVFARIFAEPLIGAAIDYEDQRNQVREKLAEAAGVVQHEHEQEIFSRAVQGSLGIGIGMVLFGAALGAIFAVAFCLCWGRTGRVRPRALAMLVALAGFVTLYLVPFLKYPANPPVVGNPDTIGPRTGLYLIMVVGSVVAALVALWLGRRVAPRLGGWNATLVGVLGFAALAGALMAVLPGLGELSSNVVQYGMHATETPTAMRDPRGTLLLPGIDADLLYSFRLYSAAGQALLWAVLGVLFAPAAERVLAAPRSEPHPTLA